MGAKKKPCGKHADSHPGFGQGPVSNPASPGRTGLEPSLSRVRRPCASPLGNLTTVTHLAGQLSSCLCHPREGQTYPYTYNRSEVGHIPTFFKHGNLRFQTYVRDLGTKLRGNNSYGCRTSFRIYSKVHNIILLL